MDAAVLPGEESTPATKDPRTQSCHKGVRETRVCISHNPRQARTRGAMDLGTTVSGSQTGAGEATSPWRTRSRRERRQQTARLQQDQTGRGCTQRLEPSRKALVMEPTYQREQRSCHGHQPSRFPLHSAAHRGRRLQAEAPGTVPGKNTSEQAASRQQESQAGASGRAWNWFLVLQGHSSPSPQQPERP